MSNLLAFNIAGTDHTDKVLFESFGISDRLDSVKTCSFKVKDVPVTCNTGIWVTDNRTSTKIFGGYITEVEKEFYKKDAFFNVCQAQDYSLILRNFILPGVNDYSAGVKSEKTILTELLTGSGITVGAYVITGANVSIVFQPGSFARAIDDLSAINGRTWYVDYNQELHYYTEGNEAAPFNFSDTPNGTTTFTYGKLKYRASYDSAVGTAYGGSLVCHKAGLMSGQTVQITNATIPLAAVAFLIKDISIQILNSDTTVTDAVEYTVYFGLTPLRITDYVNRSNQTASTVDRGLIPPLNNTATQYLNGAGAWTTPATAYTDAQALAAAVQSGAITDGVTKAPTHDAVFDVKSTADGAIAKSLLTERGSVIYRNATVPAELFHGTSGQFLKTMGDGADPVWATPYANISCKLYLSAPQTILNDTVTYIYWDAEFYDTDTMHSLSANTSRITINTAGKYSIIAKIRWVSEVTPTGYRWISLLKNGTTYFDMIRNTWGANDESQIITTILDLIATDYIEVIVLHNQGASTDVVHGNTDTSFIAFQRICD